MKYNLGYRGKSMKKIILLLLITVNLPLCSLAEVDKSSQNKVNKIDTEGSVQREQAVKDEEVKDVDLNIFQSQEVTKKDLEKNDLLIKMPKEEIEISKSAGKKYHNRTTGEQILNTHQRNQKKFLNDMRKTDNFIKKGLDREAGKNNDSSFGINPFEFPFVEPSSSDW